MSSECSWLETNIRSLVDDLGESELMCASVREEITELLDEGDVESAGGVLHRALW